MSLTSYRAAPSRVNCAITGVTHAKQPPGRKEAEFVKSEAVFCRPGSDLLSRALRQSTIGAEELNGRVRDGNGFFLLAKPPDRQKTDEASASISERPEFLRVHSLKQAVWSSLNPTDALYGH